MQGSSVDSGPQYRDIIPERAFYVRAGITEVNRFSAVVRYISHFTDVYLHPPGPRYFRRSTMTWILERRNSFHSKALNPLTFDRANGGKPTKSQFPIFVKLPVELYHAVTNHISSVDLEALAMVDHDCRQLVRSVQFVDVTMNYSVSSLALLEALLQEISTGSQQSSQTIGPCIRRVKVDLGPPLLDDACLDTFPLIFGSLASTRRNRDATFEDIQGAYLAALAVVMKHGLPNVQSLEWESRGVSTPELMECITASTVRHLSLSHFVIDSSLRTDLGSRMGWALESLVLNVEMGDFMVDQEGYSCFATELLRCVSRTLRNLSWKGGRHSQRRRVEHSFGEDIPDFPLLHTLLLDGIRMKDGSILLAFLSPKSRIRSLTIDCMDGVTAAFLSTRGHIATLERFDWTGQSQVFEQEVLSFLSDNNQLCSFDASSPQPHPWMEECLFPIITSNFRHLTALHLVWQTSYIPESALQAISRLTSLKGLWLSCGHQLGWSHEWKVDHSLLCSTLCNLTRLEKLVLTRDSYEVKGHPLLDCSIERYYVNRVLPQSVVFTDFLLPDELALLDKFFGLTQDGNLPFEQARALHTKLLKAAWERWHQMKMVDIGYQYAAVFPKLEWCFVGQYTMTIERERADDRIVLDHMSRNEVPYLWRQNL
uniref:F-box domain-containing protein n=2 Tax=Moniliophthora roreri TaxID=221103 RepID=A0A0W0GDX2_MONRR